MVDDSISAHADDNRLSALSVVRQEVSLAMAIAGGLVIRNWLSGDPEYRTLAKDEADLASLAFAMMRREQSRAAHGSSAPHS